MTPPFLFLAFQYFFKSIRPGSASIILITVVTEIVIPMSFVDQGLWTHKSDVFSSKQRS